MVAVKNNHEIINIMDTSLMSLAEKGNLSYAEELYNPLNYFACVHHISYYWEDKRVRLNNPTIKVHAFSPLAYSISLYLLAKRNKVCLIRGRGPYDARLVGMVSGNCVGIRCFV